MRPFDQRGAVEDASSNGRLAGGRELRRSGARFKYGFPKSGLQKLGELDEVVVDLFGYHPADYAILGGSWGFEEDRSLHHNLVLASVNGVAVDAVAATIMGFKPAEIRHLRMAEQMGHGSYDLDEIWMRGNDVEQARRLFRKPRGWANAATKVEPDPPSAR